MAPRYHFREKRLGNDKAEFISFQNLKAIHYKSSEKDVFSLNDAVADTLMMEKNSMIKSNYVQLITHA